MVDFAKLLAASKERKPVVTERVLDDSPSDNAIIKNAVREAMIESAMLESFADMPKPETQTAAAEGLRESLKLDKLIGDEFPFDESQLEMIDGIVRHLFPLEGVEGGQGACGTGAAGTGKTTCTQAIIDRIMDEEILSAIDMETYFKSPVPADEEDEEEIPTRWVPSVACVGFTGRSTQMIKKNFPRSWHGNIMTIHRCLAFMPVWEDYYDHELAKMRKKMRFEPSYHAGNLLPWDVILIDEAGMVGLDLWEQLRAALKPTCKIIMIGDINQLPPVHGRSVFGFAMARWPSWELTHIHRQAGVDNPIVDNAWRVLKGQTPITGGNFQMVKFDGLANKASQQVRKFIPQLVEKGIYDPIRDTTITAINGNDGSRGYALGQLPLNREFAIIFNSQSDHPRYIIDAGRERQKFAVGDKVMATRNDHEAGITNGMTGIITAITENGAWAGDRRRFGTVEAVNEYMREQNESVEDVDISLEEMMESYGAQEQGKQAAAEKKDRGPASHIVTVQFGSGEYGFEISFATLAEVASLMTAYVVTCHKMQGGESPVVIIILHDSHKAMHYREWLYTAITRASQKCILLYTDQALRSTISKQRITGSTLQQKVAAFNRLADESGLLGPAVRVTLNWGGRDEVTQQASESALDKLANHEGDEETKSNLPVVQANRFAALIEERNKQVAAITGIKDIVPHDGKTTVAQVEATMQSRLAKIKDKPLIDWAALKQKQLDDALRQIDRAAKPRVIVERVTRYIIIERAFAASTNRTETVDGGELQRARTFVKRLGLSERPQYPMLTGPATPKLLTYQPPVEVVMPEMKPGSLAFLMSKRK